MVFVLRKANGFENRESSVILISGSFVSMLIVTNRTSLRWAHTTGGGVTAVADIVI